MEASFWHQRWADNQIAFHMSEANPMLVAHFVSLGLQPGKRVFIPLCGKTLDIAWFLAKGFRVAGAELSELAIQQLFEELGVEPEITRVGNLRHYHAENIDIYVGDIFELTGATLGPVDAIYDRAALVALPDDMRKRYTAHLMSIAGKAPQLLISFEYDQSLMSGPPFSVGNDEVRQHYDDHYALTLLASQDIPGGLKGICPAMENVWLLKSG